MFTDTARVVWPCILLITTGCVAYGASLGLWRDPVMAVYVAVKLPFLLLATLGANAVVNGLIATLLGTGLDLRSSLRAQMMCFALASLVLGSLAPVTVGMALQAPSPDSDSAKTSHSIYLLSHTFLIGLAGVISQLRLWRVLRHVCPTVGKARLTLAFWLAGNALFGMQLSWVLRPFFGTPTLPVAFLRERPFDGTFIEAIGVAVRNLDLWFVFPILIGLGTAVVSYVVLSLLLKKPNSHPPQSS